jgi:hypothetical protein
MMRTHDRPNEQESPVSAAEQENRNATAFQSAQIVQMRKNDVSSLPQLLKNTTGKLIVRKPGGQADD